MVDGGVEDSDDSGLRSIDLATLGGVLRVCDVELEAGETVNNADVAVVQPGGEEAVAAMFGPARPRPLEEIHLQLGSPDTPQPVDILYLKVGLAIGLPAAMLVIFQSLVMAIIFVPVGFMLPDVHLKSKIQRRQAEILGNFSTTVDLAALIIESGLDYLTAFERIIKVAKEKTILEEELEKTINEIRLGYSRREALDRLSARTGVQEIRSLVGLIKQSDELGTSLVDLLRNFSTDLRSRRLSMAEKLAAQASTKMLFPLFIFIFPTIFILILSPMIKGLLAGGLSF